MSKIRLWIFTSKVVDSQAVIFFHFAERLPAALQVLPKGVGLTFFPLSRQFGFRFGDIGLLFFRLHRNRQFTSTTCSIAVGF